MKKNVAARLGKSGYEREEPEPFKNVMVTNNGKNAQGSSVTMGTAEMAHCTPHTHTLAKVVHNNYRNCQTTLLSYSQKGSAWSLHIRNKTRQNHCTMCTAQLLRYSMAKYKARAEHSTASKASSNKNTNKILLMNKNTKHTNN